MKINSDTRYIDHISTGDFVRIKTITELEQEDYKPAYVRAFGQEAVKIDIDRPHSQEGFSSIPLPLRLFATNKDISYIKAGIIYNDTFSNDTEVIMRLNNGTEQKLYVPHEILERVYEDMNIQS